jgi:hypothetical protein
MAVDGSTHPTPTTDVRWVGTMAAESVAARVGWLDASMVVTWEAIQVDWLVGQWDKLTAASMTDWTGVEMVPTMAGVLVDGWAALKVGMMAATKEPCSVHWWVCVMVMRMDNYWVSPTAASLETRKVGQMEIGWVRWTESPSVMRMAAWSVDERDEWSA